MQLILSSERRHCHRVWFVNRDAGKARPFISDSLSLGLHPSKLLFKGWKICWRTRKDMGGCAQKLSTFF